MNMYKFSYFDINYSVFLTYNNWRQENKPLIRSSVYELGCGVQPLKRFILENANAYIHHLYFCVLVHIRPFKLQQLIKFMIKPFYFINQLSALGLDKINKNPNEAGGYFVVAKKPL